MNEATIKDNSEATESGMKKTGNIICGSCILMAMGIPVALSILALAAKFLGYY